MTPDNTDDSAHYGIWPVLAGIALAAALIGLMFFLATGMH